MAAWLGNYGPPNGESVFGNAFTPGTPQSGDGISSPTRLLTSGEFAGYLSEELYERCNFIRSGVLATDSRLTGITGTRIEMPFFDIFDPREEVVTSGSDWGESGLGYFTSQKITADTQYAPYVTRGFKHSMDDLSKYQSGEDALAHIRTKLARALDKKWSQKLIPQMEGVFGGALADNSLDFSEAVAGNETAANNFSLQNVINTQYLLGENAQELNTIVIHPKVAAQLQYEGQLVFSSPAGVAQSSNVEWGGGGIGNSSTTLGFYNGFNIIVDSMCPVIGDAGENAQYVSYIFGAGAIRTGSQFPLAIETERNISSLQDVMVVHYSSVHHILGTTWQAAKDHPTNADLSDPSNWGLAYADHRNIFAARMVTNVVNGGVIPTPAP